MPSGRTHDRITLWMLPWIVFSSYFITRDGELTLLASGGFFFSGLMFGPDLDIHSIQYKRWGKLRWLWLPYQKVLSHRSLISHGFVLGTIVRIVYLFSWLFFFSILMVAILQLFIGFDWNWQTFILNGFSLITQEYKEEVISAFIGLEIGAMSHYLSDWLTSAYKRKNKPSKPKRKKIKVKPRSLNSNSK